MSYKILTDLKEIKEISDSLVGTEEQKTYVGFDCETASAEWDKSADRKTALSPHLGRLRLIQFSAGDECHIIDCFQFPDLSLLADSLRNLLTNPNCIKIGHNLKFDYEWILKRLGIHITGLYCTMLADNILDFRKQKGWHGLENNLWKYLGIKIDKTMQKSDWSLPILSPRQLEYAANDVKLLPALRQAQVQELKRTKQIEPARLEFAVLPVVAEMELTGFRLDKDYHRNLIDRLKIERDQKEQELNNFLDSKLNIPKTFNYDIFGNSVQVENSHTLNIRSSKQLLKAFQNIGIPITTTDANDLEMFVDKFPEVHHLLDFRNIEKTVSTYGEQLAQHINSATGRIHCNIRQYGADTGRFSISSPSLQNQPSDNWFRECYQPEKGKLFSLLDLSQIEMRIAADVSGDELMLKIFEDDLDIYSMTASKVFDIPYENFNKKNPDFDRLYKPKRAVGKTLMLGILYGLSWKGLINRLALQKIYITEKEAQEYVTTYYDTYPQLRDWLYKQENEALTKREVRNFAGYRYKLDYNKDDISQVIAVKNKGRNSPIQGGCCVILKEGMIEIYKKYQDHRLEGCALVKTVHDELITEHFPEQSNIVKEIKENAMLKVQKKYLKRVKVLAEVNLCESWADKK